MKDKKDQTKDLPLVSEMVEKLLTPGTVLGQLDFPEKPIIFERSPLSAVKKLEVKIISTESVDQSVLHKLQSNIRNTASTSI
jgi:hypothetical protein